MLKSYRLGWGGGVVVAHEILVSAQDPLVLGFWVLGLRVWGQGLTIPFLWGHPVQCRFYMLFGVLHDISVTGAKEVTESVKLNLC